MLWRLIKSITGPAKSRSGVYVRLWGGLGNQLFQYAFARFLATQGVAVGAFVIDAYDRDGYARKPLAHALSRIPAVKLSKNELASLTVVASDDGMKVIDILKKGGHANVICQGYWQDAKFANAVAAEIKGDLTAFCESNYPAIDSVDCVVHVRRYDYGHHGLLPFAYYQAALEHCGWPRFKVVTDEPNYCDYMFKRLKGYAGVAKGDTHDPWGDFFLMSKSRAQIIANSTFSWWTAWLGRATGATETVIAPAEWSLMNAAHPCPAEWHRIDTLLARP
jgi:hypothetical protein